MARQILHTPQHQTRLNVNKTQTTLNSKGIASDRDLLKKRSVKYIKTIKEIDHATLTDTIGLADLIEKIKEEFGALGIIEYPLGIVSKCYLGNPYEVHMLDLTGDLIIEHFESGRQMPGHLEKARGLALNNSYAMIEVYANKIILIREDGSTTKL